MVKIIKPASKPVANVRKLVKPLSRVQRFSTYLPMWGYDGKNKPPVMVVLDPVISATPDKINSPASGEEFRFIGAYLRENGITPEICTFLSASLPMTPEMYQGTAKPQTEHLKQDRTEFLRVVSEIKPRLIIAVGGRAMQQITGRPVKITKCRGLPNVDPLHNDAVVLPIYSIQMVRSRPEHAPVFKADIETAGRIVRNRYSIDGVYEDTEIDYRWRLDLDNLIALKKQGKLTRIAVDTETLGLRWYMPQTKILTVQICWEPGKAVAVPIDYRRVPGHTPQTRARIVRQLKEILEDPRIEKVGHNFKFDWLMLYSKLGIRTQNYSGDTILLVHADDENSQTKNLADQTRIHVPAMAGYSDEFDRDPVHLQKTRMDLVPPEKMLQYGCGDTDATLRLHDVLDTRIRKDRKAYNCYQRVVMPAQRSLCDIEQTGFPIDVAALKAFEAKYKEFHKSEAVRLVEMIPEVIKAPYVAKLPKVKPGEVAARTPEEILLGKSTMLREYLFTHRAGLRLKGFKLDKSGNPRVAKPHLVYFKEDNEFVVPYLAFTERKTMLNNFVKSFYKYIHDGWIHPTYLLFHAVTGRSSSRDPNGQNFPKRSKLAKEYRKIFRAPPGWVFLEVDFSQIELRVAAIMSGDPVMLQAYRDGKDIHQLTAMLVNGHTEESWNALPADVRKELRQKAKPVNFGYLYGMWWKRFKDFAFTDYGLKFTDEEAELSRINFFRAYPGLEPWHETMKEFALEKGFVRALDGRVRHLPQVYSKDKAIAQQALRQAVNSPVQAFASDLGLLSMARINEDVDPNRLKPLGFIHDALVCLVREEHALWGARYVKRMMESNPLVEYFGQQCDFPIPIVADPDVGRTLAEMHELAEIGGGELLSNPKYQSFKDVLDFIGKEDDLPTPPPRRIIRGITKPRGKAAANVRKPLRRAV